LLCEMPQPRRTKKEVALNLLTEMPQLRLMPRRGRRETLSNDTSFYAGISACKSAQWGLL
jgi:hypothetical protein